MLSSLSRMIYHLPLPLSLVKQRCSFASTSSSKTDSTSPSTGDTHEDGKKDIHDPIIDVSQEFGPKSEEERSEWQNEEHSTTRQKRIRANQKLNVKTETSNK